MMKCKEAVTQLLNYAAAEDYSDALTQMWEAWLTHEITEDLTAAERARMLHFYKQLRVFFDAVKTPEFVPLKLSLTPPEPPQ